MMLSGYKILLLCLIVTAAVIGEEDEAGIGGDEFKVKRFLRPGSTGPWVTQTVGEAWPKPKVSKYQGNNFMVVQMNEFTFKVTSCKIKLSLL